MKIILIIFISLIFVTFCYFLLIRPPDFSSKKVKHNNLTLYTESFGNPKNTAVILISGAGAPARFWTDKFCNKLVNAGYFVIRFDHRDQGLSSAVDFEKNPYTVLDLMDDVIFIMNAYNIRKAHIVGHSMGGFIAQLLAIYHPERVISLTSMSVGTVGDIGTPKKEIMDILLENKPTQNFEESLPDFMKSWQILNGDYALDEKLAKEYTKDLYCRSKHPVGVAWSHIKAQQGFGDLSKELKKITVPAFIIHGQKDVLIPVSAGVATSEVIPNSKLEVVSGMGHMIFNRQLEDILAQKLLENFKSIN